MSPTGTFIALDPNIRPGLIPDADTYRKRFDNWLPYVSLLKLSEEDADWLGGAVQGWLTAGPTAVVITRGGGGLTVFTRDGGPSRSRARPSRSWTRSAAGDTVNAALLHALAERDLLVPGALAALGSDGWHPQAMAGTRC